jgi:phosphatidylinositol-binding clathrin assembly protein
MRLSKNIEEELGPRPKSGKAETNGSTGGLSRGKTLAGRKLRVMTVEKGLLRETKAVQRMIEALLECRVCSTSRIFAHGPYLTHSTSFTSMILKTS